ncbi:hypothetical protein NT2_12_00940 [Caenibius tardaugens NBRC 16725]|uniref:DUF3489 domain-containing protein n=1 Tax=Caenibius tardaugens NBRC 16725 TaxID=1219035 RepID=U2YPJ7_9SPHN|nr:DUF3489 domain-containing protein [Caenibius tardaugens]AZI36365.1 DUF3489 domain-containing protein [Caenibius tardaugens NBRC 16725]GAD50830.1 hypothetical protein NT2_12_00940 [Caenibius tardaugens NBRC 16725]
MANENGTKQTAQPRTKSQLIERLLAGRGGATLAELMEPTGWQAHTCRAFLSGLRKKGRALVRDKRDDGTSFYRLDGEQEAAGTETISAIPTEGHV